MRNINFSLFLIAAFLISSFLPVLQYAQEKTQVEIENISYEEMMNIMIVTASKEEQKISDAPAIIDVITEQQIRDFDAKNLYELLSFLPGIEVMETFFGRTILNFRGVNNLHYTNKVLLMINGNPIYEPINGSYFLEQIPVNSVSRIEVIRGPGSALYGTNAYSGIINVITKTGTKGEDNTAVEVSYGSFNSFGLDLSGKIKLGTGAGLFLAGSLGSTDGYQFNVKADEKNNAFNIDYYNRPKRFFGNLSLQNFTVDFGYMDMKKSLYGITPNQLYTGDQIQRSLFANAKYSYSLSDQVSSSFSVRYNSYDAPESNIGYFPVKGAFAGHPESTVFQQVSGNILGSELQFNIDLSSDLSNVSGLVYESFYTDPYYFKWASDNAVHPYSAYTENHSMNRFAGYTQFNFKPTDVYTMIAGIRFVKDSDISSIYLLPRAGLIVKLSDKYFVKALYGKAFRAPTFFEKYVSTYNVLYGSTGLSPETIQTFDLGLEVQMNEHINGRINGFFESTADVITRVPTTNVAHGAKAADFINSSKQEVYGVEFSLNGLITETSYYGFNASWKTGNNVLSSGNTDLAGIAKISANAWVNYRYAKFFFTPNFQFVGERKGTSARIVLGKAIGDYTLNPYFLFNFTCGYKFSNFTFSLTGKNLFNVDYSYPEFIRGLSEEVPGGPERNFVFTAKVNF